MVVLLDLDEDALSQHADPKDPTRLSQCFDRARSIIPPQEQPCVLNNNGFAAALTCYPIVSQLTRSLDLNSLHALSRTCRQYRAILLHYRNSLIQQTLRCINDSQPKPSLISINRTANGGREILFDGSRFRDNSRPSTWTSSKAGPCARDMVSDCRMCGVIICRNCTEKPPPPAKLPGRLRRLCHTCLSAPLSQHTTTSIHVNGTLRHGVSRGPCVCPEAPYFCSQDGVALLSADTEYRRTWTWRTHYSTYLGGLGTGIGQGNEAVKCARTIFCLGAQIVDVDLECPSSFSGGPGLQGIAVDAQDHSGDEAGYWSQEVEGIGGVVKKKMKTRMKVGAPVREWEDEREGGQLLGREISGKERSWCAWCDRVVPGKTDLDSPS